jgi:phosphoserine aminotransferase
MLKTKRGYNFGAGPAMLPEAILKKAQAELLNWQGMDMSVMEIGHRTPEFTALMQELEQNFREVLHIPQNYHVLFMSMPARTQFAMIPMNFLKPEEKAGYLVTGLWSSFAYQEALKLKKAYCIASNEGNYTKLPHPNLWQIQPDSTYIYYTPNETIHGLRVQTPPKVGNIPLIADMTSCILSEPLDVSLYGLIFAGAQKNIANAGLTVVIISDEMLQKNPHAIVPTMMDYKTQVQAHSLYATPAGFNCYIANLMLLWIKSQGGVQALASLNQEKALKLYTYLDNSSEYECLVSEENARSLTNVCFVIKKPAMEEIFLAKAKTQGLYALKGHREAGGLRASLYNAMPLSGVNALIQFMQAFAKEYL